MKLEMVKIQFIEIIEKLSGKLKVMMIVGLGQGWLIDKIQEFLNFYFDMQVQFIFDNEELDVNMCYVDCVICLCQLQQLDFIQCKFFMVYMYVYVVFVYLS